MILKDVATALKAPRTQLDMVRVYVPGGSFRSTRPDAELFGRLRHGPPGQRIIVSGESGSGKTSLILRVIGDLARLDDSKHEPLVISIGDTGMIASVITFLQSVLATLAGREGRFANVDAKALADAAAVEQTTTKRQVSHRARLDAAAVSYQAELKEPVQTFKRATSATELKLNLNDVIASVVRAGYRPLVVIDDTDRFAQIGPDGNPQISSIENLLNNGVQVLCEVEPSVDVIVAAHPRYTQVAAYEAICARFGFEAFETPRLPVDDGNDPPPLEKLIERRLTRHGIAVPVGELIEVNAMYALEAIYIERHGSVREVLRVAEDACLDAAEKGAAKLQVQHVFAAQSRRKAANT